MILFLLMFDGVVLCSVSDIGAIVTLTLGLNDSDNSKSSWTSVVCSGSGEFCVIIRGSTDLKV